MSSRFPIAAPGMALRYGAISTVGGPVLICGMFTASYRELAQRLVSSLRQFDLPHAIFEVPTVHLSISLKGSDDPTYTKANFIWHVLALAQRPVLYVDVDCVIRRHPELIRQLAIDGHDFAILNWFALEQNDAYVPVALPPAGGAEAEEPRYYQHSYHVELDMPQQLLCSGAVQFWRQSPAAEALLQAWFSTVLAQARVGDDDCLDFSFNNLADRWRADLRPFWLPKAYARYPWWIFDEPVIDHPDIPYQGRARPEVSDPLGRRRNYPDQAKRRADVPFIPRDCVIDVRTGRIWRYHDNELRAREQRWTRALWPLQPQQLNSLRQTPQRADELLVVAPALHR